jgi:TetR/AcrR family transcriptional regulator, cholesterol catabolism regulator
MTVNSLRERKKAATKERIYLEALELFRKEGFSSTTVDEIAEAAEVSKGTFFNYYTSKESLLRYAGERYAAVAAGTVQATMQDAHLTLRQKLSRMLNLLAAAVDTNRDVVQVAVIEVLKAPNAVAEIPYRGSLQDAVTALLAEGQARGEMRPDLSPSVVSSAIISIYFMRVFEWGSSKDPAPFGQHLEELLDLLWEGIVPGR